MELIPNDTPDEKQQGGVYLHLPKQSKSAVATSRRVYDRFTAMRSNRVKHGDGKWDKWIQLFQNTPTGTPPEDWMANVFVPFIMSIVLAVLAEVTNRRERWELRPQTKDDEKAVAKIQAVTDQSLDKGFWNDEQFKADLDKYILGTKITKEVYREDRRIIRDKVNDKITQREIREFNDVYGYHVPLQQFYLDDKVAGEGIRGAEDCIERKVMGLDLFKIRYGRFKDANKVKPISELKLTDEELKAMPPGGQTTPYSFWLPISNLSDDQIEVLEYWNKTRDEHIVVANGIVVVDEPNPYFHKQLPYSIDVCIPKPGSAYGIGMPEALEPSQEELNTLHNLAIDVSKINAQRPTFVGGMSLTDESSYGLKPGVIINVDTVAEIKESIGTPLGMEIFKMFEEVKQSMRIAAGLDPRFAEASPAGGSDTATDVLKLAEASARRIGMYTKISEIRYLPRIAMLRTANIQQFYSDPERLETILGDDNQPLMDELTNQPKEKAIYRMVRFQPQGKSEWDFVEVKPEDIRCKFDPVIIPQSTQELSEAAIAKSLQSAIQIVLSYPPALQVIDLVELMKQYVKSIHLPTSIVKTVISEPENDDFNLANQENQAMIDGIPIPGTPNPSARHTHIHSAYIYKTDPQTGDILTGESDSFKALPKKIQGFLLKHLQDEMKQHEAKGNVSAEGLARTPSIGGQGQQAMPNLGGPAAAASPVAAPEMSFQTPNLPS